mgnify:FL=1
MLRPSAVDYGLSRRPGLEWQDEVADVVAAAVLSGDVNEAVSAGVNKAQKFAKGSGRDTQLHVRWAVQDGIARGVIQKQRSDNLFKVLEPPAPKKKGKTPPPPSD